MTQVLQERRTYRIEFLSPAHVGTEEQLGIHDLLYRNGSLCRVRPEPLLEAISASGPLLDQYLRSGLSGIADWLQRQSALLDRISLYASPTLREPRWQREPVRPFLADTMCRPYVPGTEVKGAIRTALAWSLVDAYGARADLERLVGRRPDRGGASQEVRDRRKAGEWLVQRLLGRDPNHDLLRSLRVQDSTPVSASKLAVVLVLVAARGGSGLRLMQGPRRDSEPGRYTDDMAQAVGNFCECLDPQASGVTVTVEFDRFLTAGRIHRRVEGPVRAVLEWDDRIVQAVHRWPEACNAFARDVAEREARWWQEAARSAPQRLGRLAGAMEAFYALLQQRMARSPAGHVFLNLGWGGGWRTKTVAESFGEAVVEQVVQRYGLDRGARSRPFPKTRKVAWLGLNEFQPLGWVALVPQVQG